MSDRSSQTLAGDPETSPTDWHSAAPTVGLRSLAGIALMVPLLLAAGVYWLHQVPAGTGPRATDTVVEVRLIAPQEPIEQRQDAPLQPSQAALNPQPEPLVEDPNRLIPTETVVSAPSEPGRPASAATTSAPASAAAPVRMPTIQIAKIFQTALLSHIARYRRYPDAARQDRLQGIVQAVFAMRRDGTVTEVWIKSTSGHKLLDVAAIETIRRAQPLPKIPSELPDHLNILMPVAFDLP